MAPTLHEEMGFARTSSRRKSGENKECRVAMGKNLRLIPCMTGDLGEQRRIRKGSPLGQRPFLFRKY